jgi:hypothetical protein
MIIMPHMMQIFYYSSMQSHLDKGPDCWIFSILVCVIILELIDLWLYNVYTIFFKVYIQYYFAHPFRNYNKIRKMQIE